VDHDARQAVVLDDELATEVAELDRLLTHEGASCQLGAAAVLSAWLTLPDQGRPCQTLVRVVSPIWLLIEMEDE
jgi:hypothetical protein